MVFRIILSSFKFYLDEIIKKFYHWEEFFLTKGSQAGTKIPASKLAFLAKAGSRTLFPTLGLKFFIINNCKFQFH